MKASRQIKLLQGVTAIRVRLGFTQKQFGEYLLISRSTVSMIEGGKRIISAAALRRISQLEISLLKTGYGNAELIGEPGETEKLLEKKEMLTRERNLLLLSELRYKLNRMKMKFEELGEAAYNLRWLLAESTDAAQTARFQIARDKVAVKLKRCDRQAQAKLEGRMAQLEIIIAASEEIDARMTGKEAENEAIPTDISANLAPAINEMDARKTQEMDSRMTQIETDEAGVTPTTIPAKEPLAIPTGYRIDAALLKENTKRAFVARAVHFKDKIAVSKSRIHLSRSISGIRKNYPTSSDPLRAEKLTDRVWNSKD
jgi:transcriptional regulator with XRE-family HTH domain